MSLWPLRSVLFIRLRLLGDIILTIPSLLRFRKAYPEAAVYYALEDPFAQLAELLPGVDECFVIPRKLTMRDYIRWGRQIREREIDTVIDFHSGPKSALLTRLSGCATRIGYRTRNRNWAYTHLCENRDPRRPVMHSALNQSSMLELIGLSAEPLPDYQLKISPSDISLPAQFNSLSRKCSAGQVAIHIGAGNPFRYWGDSRYQALLKSLTDEGVCCHLIGNSPQEAERSERWRSISPDLIHDWVGKLTLLETLGLIDRSSCYFGPDSGPMHLASLTRTPIVAVFGPNIPAISGPWRKQDVTVLETPLPCRPCSQRGCLYDTIQCMEGIDAETAVKTIFGYLVH